MRILVRLFLSGSVLALATPAGAQDSYDASEGSSEALVLSAEAVGTLSEAGIDLAWASAAAAGEIALAVVVHQLAASEEVLGVLGGTSHGPLIVDDRVIVPGPPPAVPFEAGSQPQE